MIAHDFPCAPHDTVAKVTSLRTGIIDYWRKRGRQPPVGELPEQVVDPEPDEYGSGFDEQTLDDIGEQVSLRQFDISNRNFDRFSGIFIVTPMPQHGFPGLVPGDRWCLCASRWQEAFEAGVAPPVHLSATHARAGSIRPIRR